MSAQILREALKSDQSFSDFWYSDKRTSQEVLDELRIDILAIIEEEKIRVLLQQAKRDALKALGEG